MSISIKLQVLYAYGDDIDRSTSYDLRYSMYNDHISCLVN
jgi:hypothetical protein